MPATVRSFRGVGFDGSVCADHAPSMEGEGKCEPGCGILGRLFALGYLKCLLEALRTGALAVPWPRSRVRRSTSGEFVAKLGASRRFLRGP